MNRHDYIHLFKAMNEHLRQAIVHNTNIVVQDHLQKAKDALWVVADDMGVELINGGD
jgi:hypothetical protein